MKQRQRSKRSSVGELPRWLPRLAGRRCICITGLTLTVILIAGCQGGAPATTVTDAAGQAPVQAGGETAKAPDGAQFQPAAVGRSMLQTPDDLADELTLQQEQERAGSDAAVAAAKKALNELDFTKAETLLRRALQLNPANAVARQELDKVLFILGDRRGEIANVAREEAERELVRRQQAQVELRRRQGSRALQSRRPLRWRRGA